MAEEETGIIRDDKCRAAEEAPPGYYRYYGICAVGGGMLSAAATHLTVTPLDVLKVNMQVNPVKYYRIYSCSTPLLREQGPSAFWGGWATKFFGYGAQDQPVEKLELKQKQMEQAGSQG